MEFGDISAYIERIYKVNVSIINECFDFLHKLVCTIEKLRYSVGEYKNANRAILIKGEEYQNKAQELRLYLTKRKHYLFNISNMLIEENVELIKESCPSIEKTSNEIGRAHV